MVITFWCAIECLFVTVGFEVTLVGFNSHAFLKEQVEVVDNQRELAMERPSESRTTWYATIEGALLLFVCIISSMVERLGGALTQGLAYTAGTYASACPTTTISRR